MAGRTPRGRPPAGTGAGPDEATWLASYDPSQFPPFAVTVDIAAFTIRDGDLCALLIRRGEHPQLGRWALPGGHVRHGLESAGQAAHRELEEETGVVWPEQPFLEQLATYSDPRRDPRIAAGLQVVTVAFVALAAGLPDPVAATDATDARWWPVSLLDVAAQRAAWSAGAAYTGAAPALAFDHALILDDGLERIRAKLEYTTIATRFVPEPFTLADLRAVYATVWGYDPEPANFRRKVFATAGFVTPIPTARRQAGPQGGRPPALFTRGPAERISPPLPREPHSSA